MEKIDWNQPITIPSACPICKGDLEFQITGSEEGDDGLQHPTMFDVQCSNEDFEKGIFHNVRHPYVEWHPYITKIEEELTAKYYIE